MRPPVTVREAVRGDIEAIAAVHVRAATATYGPLGAGDYLAVLTLDRRITQWEATFAALAPPTAVYVAVYERVVVGFAHVSASRDRDAAVGSGELDRLYVDPDMWGRGVGSRLIEVAVTHLASAGFERATLWVLETNSRARRFYEAAGWTIDGAPQPAGGWIGFSNVRYQRSLPPAAPLWHR